MSELIPYGLELFTDSDSVDEKPLIWGKISPAIHMFPDTTLKSQCACAPNPSPATAVPPTISSVEPISTDPDRANSEPPNIGSDDCSVSRKAIAELDVKPRETIANSDLAFNPSIKKLAELLQSEKKQRKYSLPEVIESEERVAALAGSMAVTSVENEEEEPSSVSVCGSPPSPVVSELEFEFHNLEPECVYVDPEVDEQFTMASASAFELTSSEPIPTNCSSTVLSKAQVDCILNMRARSQVSETLLQESDDDNNT